MSLTATFLLRRLSKAVLRGETSCYYSRRHWNTCFSCCTVGRVGKLCPFRNGSVFHNTVRTNTGSGSDTKSGAPLVTQITETDKEKDKWSTYKRLLNIRNNNNQAIHISSDNNKNDKEDSTLRKVIKLAQPEFTLITGSALTLGITSSITLLLPYASGKVIDISMMSINGDPAAAAMLSPVEAAGGLFGLVVVSGAGVFARSVMLNIAGNRIVARLRKRLFRAALAQETAFFDQVHSIDNEDNSSNNGSTSKYSIDEEDGENNKKSNKGMFTADTTSRSSGIGNTTRTGDLLSRLSSDAQMIQTAVTTHAVGSLRGIVMSTGATMMLLKTSPTLALVSLSTLPPIFFLARRFGKSMKGWQSKVQEMQSDASSLAEEVFSGIKTVRQFAAEPYEAGRYGEKIDAAHNEAIKAGKAQAMFDGSVHVAANAAILIVIGYGGTMVISGDITAGELTSFLMYSMLSAGNISSLSSTYADMMKAFGAAGRVFSIIDRLPQIPPTITVVMEDDNENNNESGKRAVQCATAPVTITSNSSSNNNRYTEMMDNQVQKQIRPLSVEFRNIEFAYPSRRKSRILGPEFSLSVNAGENVALVGSSGSGKSTVAALLTRLYDISSTPNDRVGISTTSINNNGAGEISNTDNTGIFIDGTNICDIHPQWLRENVGVVSQEPLLFAASIADNIRYGRRDASMDEIYEAARIANVLEFTNDLEGTLVGPRGSQLSGGQKQRVAVARLILKNPPIIIFDEATSALDAHSEFHVQQAIEQVMKNRTVISIAHRLSTIQSSDRIAVLHSGKIVEEGTLTELVRKKEDGEFWNLMFRQLTNYKNKPGEKEEVAHKRS